MNRKNSHRTDSVLHLPEKPGEVLLTCSKLATITI